MEDLYKKEDLLNIASFLDTKLGLSIIDVVERITKLDKLNLAYRKSSIYEGVDCATAMLRNCNAKYTVGGLPLDKLPDGPFITISNHPYGGIDGLALIDLIGKVRPDFKVMVNKILGLAKKLGPNFITVTPKMKSTTNASSESVGGVKECITQIKSGGVLGLFPAGAVSDLKPFEGFKIRDREWQLPVIKLIKKLQVPVVPIRFFDKNSMFYYLLGLIDWKVRITKLPSEILNKKGKDIRIGIGDVISVEQINEHESIESLRDYLRSSVYDMQLPESFV